MDELTFLERYADQLSIDATTNRDRVEGRNGAKTIEINGQVAALSGGNDNRHNKVTGARTAFGLIGGSSRGRVSSLAGITGAAVKPSANYNRGKHENPGPKTALGRGSSRCAASAGFGKVHGINLTHSFTPVGYSAMAVRASLPKAGQSQLDATGCYGLVLAAYWKSRSTLR